MSYDIACPRPMPPKKSKTTNILTLDGGGVRGLSSLIILKRLMKYVNEQEDLQPGGLTPKDIFSLVAGTSTGGLSALMLGRFGMSVDDCITQYPKFSEEIFGHYSKRGRWSLGILKDRYDGNRLRNSVRQLAARKDTCDNESVLMQGPEHENGIPCTVLAAEFEGNDIRDEPAYLCTHNCDEEFECRVCDAAQATAAAPSYFPPCRIGDRYFIDGGFGHNNPSLDIYTHYTNVLRYNVFPRVDMNKILIVNIGTGIDSRRVRQSDGQGRRHSPRTQVRRHRQSLTGIANMLRQMKSHTINAQAPFYILKAISRANEGMLDVHRFTADTGLHEIKLDEYRELKDIEKLTNEYIDRPEIARELMEVAEKLANGWREQNSPTPVPIPTSDGEAVPHPVTDPHFTRPQDATLSHIHQPAANLLPDASGPSQDTSIQPPSPPTARATSPGSLIQPPEQLSPHQPSPSTMPGSTLGPDTLGEDAIDIGLAPDRAEPSDTTPLTIQERAHDPLPDTLPSRSAHPTVSLGGTTPAASSIRENSLYADLNDKELGMGLGGQFGHQESVS